MIPSRVEGYKITQREIQLTSQMKVNPDND
jgi:hypothetical protein